MSTKYYFPGQFSCMYCKENFDPDDELGVTDEGPAVDLKCPKCEAVWRFWLNIQLCHKLIAGGRSNKTKALNEKQI